MSNVKIGDLSRKGAKAQSAAAFLRALLCAFAPLRLCVRNLPSPLANLLRSKAPDSIQTEAENYPVLFSETHIEGRKLAGHSATIPAMAQRYRRVDKRAVAPSWSLLKIKEERGAAK